MRRNLLFTLALVLVAYCYGAYSFAYRTFPIHLVGSIWRFVLPDRGVPEPPRHDLVADGSGRQAVDCGTIRPDAAILLIMGQSNAANSGTPDSVYKSKNDVINFNWIDGKCYHAEDPVLGTDGYGGTIWTRLGDELIDSGAYKQVVLVDIAVSGTPIRAWAGADGPTRHALEAAAVLRRYDRHFTHVLWHQGESDWQTPGDIYIRLFHTMAEYLRDNGIDAPIFVAQTTLCKGRRVPEIQQAQIRLPATMDNVFAGANADEVDRLRDRQDDLCHFQATGLAQLARLWRDAIIGPRHAVAGF